MINWFKNYRKKARARKLEIQRNITYQDEIFGAIDKKLDSDQHGWKRVNCGEYIHKKDNIKIISSRSQNRSPGLLEPQEIYMPERWKIILDPKLDIIEFAWKNNNQKHIIRVINGEYPLYIKEHVLSSDKEKKAWFEENVKDKYVNPDQERTIYFLEDEVAMAWKLTFGDEKQSKNSYF